MDSFINGHNRINKFMSNLNNKVALINMLLGSSLGSSLFCFLARTTAWPNGDTPPIDSNNRPTSDQADFENEYLYFKMLDTRNLRFFVLEKAWNVGNSYTINDFVKTPQNRIYRCSKAGTATKIPGHSSGINPEAPSEAEWEYITYLSQTDEFIISDFPGVIPLGMECERFFYKPYILGALVYFEIVGNEENYLPSTVEYRTAGLYTGPNTNKRKVAITPENMETVTETGIPLVWSAFKGTAPTDENIQMHKFIIGFD